MVAPPAQGGGNPAPSEGCPGNWVRAKIAVGAVPGGQPRATLKLLFAVLRAFSPHFVVTVPMR